MKKHRIDPVTKRYISTDDVFDPRGEYIEGPLPEITEKYTVAFIDGEWVSVLHENYEIVNNEIVDSEIGKKRKAEWKEKDVAKEDRKGPSQTT
jgi:hypothetical protein